MSDLRRLLEMYKRWQDRIFPGVEFDSFIGDVEKLSNSNILKTELQDMRMDLIKVLLSIQQRYYYQLLAGFAYSSYKETL